MVTIKFHVFLFRLEEPESTFDPSETGCSDPDRVNVWSVSDMQPSSVRSHYAFTTSGKSFKVMSQYAFVIPGLKLGHNTHLQHPVSLLKLGHITHLQHTVSLLKLGHITHLQHPVSLLKLGHITNLIILRLCNTVGVAAKCDHIGPDHNWWFYPNDNNNRIWSNKV